jgi:hypothetical protein
LKKLCLKWTVKEVLKVTGAIVEYSISEMTNLYYKNPYTEMKNRAMIFYKIHHL